jgi:hypothetical protein
VPPWPTRLIRYPEAGLSELASPSSEITTNILSRPKGSQHNLREAESVPTRVLDRPLQQRIIHQCYRDTAARKWRKIEQHPDAVALGSFPTLFELQSGPKTQLRDD